MGSGRSLNNALGPVLECEEPRITLRKIGHRGLGAQKDELDCGAVWHILPAVPPRWSVHAGRNLEGALS